MTYARVAIRALLPLCGGAAAALLAQDRVIRSVPDHPGRFAPLTVYLPGRRDAGPTAAEARAMKSQLDSLVTIIRRSPGLAEPRGFETTGSETVQPDPLPESEPWWTPVRGSLLIIPLLFYRTCDSCAIQKSGEGVGAQVGINDMRLAMPGSGLGGCGGPVIFLEPREVTRVGGYPMYDNGAVLVAAREVPPFLPVTRDEWVQAQIDATKNRYGCNRADPMESRRWDSIRGSWTAEERAAIALEHPPGTRLTVPVQYLAAPGTPRARQYVRVHPALYDSTLARTAMQTLVLQVALPRRDPRPRPRGTRLPLPCSETIPRSTDPQLDALAIHEAIWCRVDWSAVRALLR